MYYVYVLFSQRSGKYYKGLTNDLSRRLNQHASGKVKFTKNMRPLLLVTYHTCQTRIEARKLEKYFKSGRGREIIKKLNN